MLKILAGATLASLLWVGTAAAGSITLYSEPGFGGEAVTLRRDVDNFAHYPPWNDRARSLVVNSGTWEVCKHAGFEKCRTLGPGAKIGHLGEIKYLNEISSLRELGGYARREPRRDDRWDRDDRWNRDPWDRDPRDRHPPAPPPPRWGDRDRDRVIWDDDRGRGRDEYAWSSCQQRVYAGFVERYGYRAKANFTGGGQDGVIWWNGEPWRYSCGASRINIWQDGRR